ncbi:putative transcription factor bHLH family [Helianthus debilis subsp. tardiflorus]
MQYINQTMGIYDCSSMFQPSPSSPIPLVIHPYHHHTTFNHLLPCPTGDNHQFHHPAPLYSAPASLLPSHDGFFKRVVDGLQFAYEGGSTTTSSSTDHHLWFHAVHHGSDPSSVETETSKTNTQEMVDAKAVAASKSHSEAERRRRERINNHLAKLRSLLPNTTRTDKASLLAEVVQHVKELKHQTSIIAKQSTIPSEIDELTIENTSDEDGRIVIRASLCCDDRSDLLKDLIKTFKMLRLRTLKAEITTLGRRVKNVLFVTGEDHHSISAIEETLKSLIGQKTNDGDGSSFVSIKRRRTNNIDIFEHRRYP